MKTGEFGFLVLGVFLGGVEKLGTGWKEMREFDDLLDVDSFLDDDDDDDDDDDNFLKMM